MRSHAALPRGHPAGYVGSSNPTRAAALWMLRATVRACSGVVAPSARAASVSVWRGGGNVAVTHARSARTPSSPPVRRAVGRLGCGGVASAFTRVTIAPRGRSVTAHHVIRSRAPLAAGSHLYPLGPSGRPALRWRRAAISTTVPVSGVPVSSGAGLPSSRWAPLRDAVVDLCVPIFSGVGLPSQPQSASTAPPSAAASQSSQALGCHLDPMPRGRSRRRPRRGPNLRRRWAAISTEPSSGNRCRPSGCVPIFAGVGLPSRPRTRNVRGSQSYHALLRAASFSARRAAASARRRCHVDIAGAPSCEAFSSMRAAPVSAPSPHRSR